MVDANNLTQGELRSEVIIKEDKKYHVDLKENARGRFLKVSETFTRGYSRFQIFIPADGMEEFNNHLKELIEEYDDGEAETASQAPQSRHVRIENKNFFFSCKKNAQGRYITISEVKGNFRNSILIPESGWDDFREVFDEYTKQCKEQEWEPVKLPTTKLLSLSNLPKLVGKKNTAASVLSCLSIYLSIYLSAVNLYVVSKARV